MIYGSALRAGLQGAQDGQDRVEMRAARKYGMERRQVLDQQADEDRARQNLDYQQFQRPKMEREEKAALEQDQRNEKMRIIHDAYISHDPDKAADLYNKMVGDGYTVNIVKIGEDQYEIQHPNGRSVSNWDGLYFGKEDGTGLGLFQMIDPMGTLKAVGQKRADAKQTAKEKREQDLKVEDDKRKHGYRMSEIGASAAAQRQNTMLSQGQPFQGDDGNMYMLRPDGSVQPVMNNGQMMKASKYGMGLPRASSAGAAANPFGNSAKSQERWTRANMLAASDASGQLRKLLETDPYAVASLVDQFDQAGANRTARMKIARDMVKQAASGIGETMTAEEINARATELMTVIDSIAGPAPVAPGATGGAAAQPDAMSVPDVGTVVDGYRYLGGDPNNESSWEPVQ